jgi:hypothetical protein
VTVDHGGVEAVFKDRPADFVQRHIEQVGEIVGGIPVTAKKPFVSLGVGCHLVPPPAVISS